MKKPLEIESSPSSLTSECEWHADIGQAISLLGSPGFYEALSSAFTRLAEISSPLFLCYPVDGRPQALFSCYSEAEEHQRQVTVYLQGPYILDPFYNASLSGVSAGAYQLKDVAPDNFKRTEFYRAYYKATNLTDELSYLQPLPEGGHLHISLAHTQEKRQFSARTLKFLKEVRPTVSALLLKHWQLLSPQTLANTTVNVHHELLRALDLFGSSILTEREQSVLQLILRGHSNKSVSSKLDIAVSTVKLHRKHFYQKLDISSQAELFYLFIDSLSCLSPEEVSDPLQSYMDLSR